MAPGKSVEGTGQQARRRLTKDDWTAAALAALAERGVAGVAVEPLAAGLGSTKGSFYWHFADRDELLRAALHRWEHNQTDAVIDQLAHLTTPLERLRGLMRTTLGVRRPDLSVRLLADAAHPAVAPVLHRVQQRRVEYVADQVRQAADVDEATAGRRATLGYATYVGWSLLRQVDPAGGPTGEQVEAAVGEMLRLLVG